MLETSAGLALREAALARPRYAVGVDALPDKLGAIRAAAGVLAAGKVAYALIGGLAVGIRSGVPRATRDVDFAIDSRTDIDALVAALHAAGFVLIATFEHSVNFEHASGEPVQLAHDVAFDPMIARAETMDLGGLSLPVVTKPDLIAMKRRAATDPGRRRSKALRDQADIALLEGDVPDPHEGW